MFKYLEVKLKGQNKPVLLCNLLVLYQFSLMQIKAPNSKFFFQGIPSPRTYLIVKRSVIKERLSNTMSQGTPHNFRAILSIWLFFHLNQQLSK